MKINHIVAEERIPVEEGFWDDIKSAYRAGQRDYIARKAAELGITPQAAVQQAQAQPPGSNAPATRPQGGGKVPGQLSQTPAAVRKRAARAAAKTAAAPAATSAPTTMPAPAAPAAKPRVRRPAGSSPVTTTPAPTLSGGLKGPGNPSVDPATGWPKGAQSWAAGPLPPRPGMPAAAPAPKASTSKPATATSTKTTTGAKKQPAAGVTPSAAQAAPASSQPAATPTPTYADIEKTVAGLSKAEQRKLLGQLLKTSGTKVAATK